MADILMFGKYRGKTFEEVLKVNPGYLQWCLDNVGGFAKGLPANVIEHIEAAVHEYHYGYLHVVEDGDYDIGEILGIPNR